MRTNTQLLIILIGLIAWLVIDLTMDFGKKTEFANLQEFAVTDTADIQSITIQNQQQVSYLKREQNSWTINNKPAEDGMIKVLLSILHQVKVKRLVPKNEVQQVNATLQKRGIQVTVNTDGKDFSFVTAGNQDRTVSYGQIDDQRPATLYLPGYNSYVTGIFEVQPNDWRHRAIFRSSAHSLKSVTVSYPNNPAEGFTILPDEQKWKVDHYPAADPKKIFEYLSQFGYFQVDQYIDKGQVPQVDELLQGKPSLVLTIDDINPQQKGTLELFETPTKEKLMAGLLNHQQIVLIDKKRVTGIFKKKQDFKADSSK